MPTITTTTQANPLATPNTPSIAYDLNFADLYAVVRTGADTLSSYISTDNGSSWLLMDSFTHTGLQEWSGPVIDTDGYGHIVYRVHTGTADIVYHRGINLTSELWTGATQASATDANGGVAGSRWQGLDLAVYQRSSSAWYIVWVGGYSDGAGRYGCGLGALTQNSGGAVSISHNTIISGTRFWMFNGSGRIGPSIEVEHNGSGFDVSGTPNLWITFGRPRLSMVKMAWNGAGWTGPSGAVTLRTSMGNHDYTPGRWDGVRWLSAIINPDATSTVLVYQRNQANTSTSSLTTPVHPAGVVRQLALSYNNGTKDLRVYAVGTSSDLLYFVTYVRATSSWGAWSTVTATAVLGGGSEWSVRRGGTYGNGRYDVLTAHSGAPNTVVNTSQTTSSPPAISSFDTSGQAYTNGGPANVAAALPLAWTFSDPDPNQTQGAYALRRQIGNGALQYYTAAGGTWGASEVFNASGVQGVTLASGWGADADANHQYKVRVQDSAGVSASDYSAALTLVPSAVVNPTVTAPVAASTLTTDTVTVTWTVAQQSGFRVVLTQTAPVTSNVVRHDSGVVAGSGSTSYQVPYKMPTGTSWSVALNTYNNEGLISATQTRAFTVAYAPPPAALSAFTASTLAGTITVTPNILASVGTQPAVVGHQLFRRKVASVNQLANPTFTGGSSSGWVAADGPTMTVSTAQVRVGTHSLRLVPNGAGATPRAQTTAAAAIVVAGLASTPWTGEVWIRPDTANKPMHIRLIYYDAGGSELGTVTLNYTNVVAAAWQFLTITGQGSSFPTAARIGVGAGLGSTPAAGDAFYLDGFSLRPANTDTGTRLVNETGAPAARADWGAAHGVPVEYRWLITGANGTTQESPWLG